MKINIKTAFTIPSIPRPFGIPRRNKLDPRGVETVREM